MDLNKMSLKEKIGQKFMIGINSYNVDKIIDLIKNYHIGGVILYKKNYNTYEEMLSVIKKLKIANASNKMPLFISIDQEGGRVNRMPSEINRIKNIYDMSKKNNELIYENALITGKMLFDSGINMNFAPVMDLCGNNKSKILYNRCFYGDVKDVTTCGRIYVNGLKDNGVLSVIKHFPGHGVSKIDSHFMTPYIYNNEKILQKHIKPFDNIIKSGVDVVMVGHLVVRGMTGGMPASISYDFIHKYLRERNNYDGLVITDDISMISRNIVYKFNYMKKLFVSDSDIILIKIKENSNVDIIDKFINFIKNNKEYMTMIDNSVRRIVNVKGKYNINDNVDYDGMDINVINKRIDDLNSKCC